MSLPEHDGLRTATFEITPEDMVAAQRLFYWTSVRRDNVRVALVWLGSVVAFAGFSAFLSGLTAGLVRSITTFALAAPLVLVLIPALFIYLFGMASARKTYRMQKSLHGPVQLRWDDVSVFFSHLSGDATLKWADAYRAASDSKIVLIYESNRLYRMIPKRFLSAAQAADLDALVAKVRSGAG